MKESLVAGFLAAAVLAASSVHAAERLPRGIRWQSDFNAAQRLSRQSQKPMLLVVGADWCTWCRKLERTTLSDSRLGSYINANFVPVHVDADRDSRLVQTLRAESLPTAVILSPDSKTLGRISGYKDVAGYQAALATAADRQPAPTLARTPARPANSVVQSKVATPAATKPAAYHKVYPTYHGAFPGSQGPPSNAESYRRMFPTG